MAMAFVGCDNDNLPHIEPEKNIEMSRAESESMGSIANFSFDLLANKIEENDSLTKENFVISPLGLATSLAMVCNGADEQFQNELLQLFHIEDNSLETMNQMFRKLLVELPSLDSKSQLKLANSVWTDIPSSDVPQDYVDKMISIYGAPVTHVDDFINSQTLARIERWANDATNGLIDFKIDASTPTDTACHSKRLDAIAAMFFKGAWRTAFKPEKTTIKTFHNIDHSTSSVPMMNGKIKGSLEQREQYYVARLPYGNNSFSMYLLEPKDGTSMAELARELSNGLWRDILSMSQSENDVDIELPRFNIESNVYFDKILQASGLDLRRFNTKMGINEGVKLFDLDSGFLILNRQQTIIKVDEEGTTAVSVTKTTGSGVIMDYYNHHIFDHPFVFVLSERSTGAILVAGCVNKL